MFSTLHSTQSRDLQRPNSAKTSLRRHTASRQTHVGYFVYLSRIIAGLGIPSKERLLPRIWRVSLAALLLAICSVAVALLSLYHPKPEIEPSGVANDFSRLNRTTVHAIVHPTTEEQIRDAVQEAAAKGLKVAIAGKRHSMGGQTLYPDAIALDMLAYNKIVSLDDANKILTVQSGATWSDIQEFLNPRGLAVFSMQGPTCSRWVAR